MACLERIFVGIKIPSVYARMVSQLYGTSTETDKRLKNCKWVPEDNLHLTLSFIGEVPPDKRQLIQETLRTVNFASFSLRLVNKIATFPEKARKNVRVLHLPLVQPSENAGKDQWSLEVEGLKTAVDEVLKGCQTFIESSLNDVPMKSEPDNGVTDKTKSLVLTPHSDKGIAMESTPSKGGGSSLKKKKEAFHPHLTISRVKQHCKLAEVFDLVDQMNQEMEGTCDSIWKEMTFSVEEFFLFRSTLTPQDAIYDVIESYRCQ